jgi:sporulation protein YqfD
MKLFRFVTGWARAAIAGDRPERILQTLAERGIPFWDASPPESFMLHVSVPWGAAALLPELCRSMGCECTALERHGLPEFLKCRRVRVLLVLLAGIFLALAVSWGRIWDIEIEGNETIPDGVILQALSECGIDIGKSWLSYSQDSVRNGVILRIPEIRWMTVTMQGCRAIVIVREKRTYIEPVPEDEYADIVAEKAGLIVQIDDLRGTAVTEAGKTVLPGETLIAGYASGRFGVQGPVRAIGTVWAMTWYDITMAGQTVVKLKEQTGTQKTLFSLILGKMRINFYKGSSICTADCDKIIDRYTAAKSGWFALPLTLERITLRPYTVQEQTAAELEEELSQVLMEELCSRIGEDGQVVSYTYTSSQTDGVLYVTLHAQCQEQIGITVPWGNIQTEIPQTEETDP